MNYTSVEQAEELVKLGLNPRTADLTWKLIYDEDHQRSDHKLEATPWKFYEFRGVPCWSLAALMDLLPPSINHYNAEKKEYRTYGLNLFRAHYHCCGYCFGPSLSKEDQDHLCCFGENTWFKAVYKTMIWCLENKLMNN